MEAGEEFTLKVIARNQLSDHCTEKKKKSLNT